MLRSLRRHRTEGVEATLQVARIDTGACPGGRIKLGGRATRVTRGRGARETCARIVVETGLSLPAHRAFVGLILK